jgi:SMODS and SLOG-associating 2TM effector domain 1/SMODS and SLOG-associating 2TM effector domain 3
MQAPSDPTDDSARLAFPAVWQVADSLAAQRQRRFMSLVMTQLLATVSAAVLSQVGALVPDQPPLPLEAISATCLAIAIGVQLLSHRAGWNRDWFEDRAVAEATLSASWRFMIRVPPFADERTDAPLFASVLEREIPRGSSTLATRLAPLGRAAFQPTPAMLRVRQSAWAQRARLYVERRLVDQKEWYAAKAGYNMRRERWFWLATLAANVGAATFLLVHFLNPASNFVGVMTTLAAALIAWSSTRRFRELGESYTALAVELGRMHDRMLQARSDEDVVSAAAAAEEIMVHEQWVWVARRVERHVGPPPLRHR